MTDEQNINRDIERDAIWLAVVNSICRDFPNSKMSRMSDEQVAATAASWADHLKHIPPRRVMGIYKKLTFGAKNPPVISDFAHTWGELYSRELEQLQDKKRLREDAEMKKKKHDGTLFSQATESLIRMNRQRWAAGMDAVCCDCEQENGLGVTASLTRDEKYFCCKLRQCDFRKPVEKFMEIRTHPSWKPVNGGVTGSVKIPNPGIQISATPAVPVPMTDDELLRELSSRCDIIIPDEQKAYWVGFAEWLRTQVAVEVWTCSIAASFYKKFKEVRYANT